MSEQGWPTYDEISRAMQVVPGAYTTSTGIKVISALFRSRMEDVAKLEAELEQERVRLAGCGVASSDGREETACHQGDYGWSASYQSVLELRRRCDTALTRIAELEAKLRTTMRPMVNYQVIMVDPTDDQQPETQPVADNPFARTWRGRYGS